MAIEWTEQRNIDLNDNLMSFKWKENEKWKLNIKSVQKIIRCDDIPFSELTKSFYQNVYHFVSSSFLMKMKSSQR